MAAHRYWRLRVTSIQGDTELVLTRLWFVDRTGKTTTNGGTPIAGSTTNGNVSNLSSMSSITSGFWATTNAGARWAGYDYGFGNEKDIVGVGVSNLNSNAAKSPAAGVVEWSDDGSTWTSAFNVTFDTWTSQSEIRVHFDPAYSYTGSPWGAHTYWRFQPIRAGSNSLRAAELRWRSEPDGPQVAVGGTPSQSNTWSTQVAALAYDNNLSTFAETSSSNFSDWMRYQFASAVPLAELGYVGNNSSNTPSAGIISWSDDGINWNWAFVWTGKSFAAGTETKITDPAWRTPPTGAPTVTSFEPASGPEEGGTLVTITGTELGVVTGVKFGGTSAGAVTIVSGTELTCVSPPGTGSAAIELVYAGGTVLAGSFLYVYTGTYPTLVTQVPVLVIDKPNQRVRVAQVPILVIDKPSKGVRVTQAPVLVPFKAKDPLLPKPLIPQWPISETWQYKTTISRAAENREQRAALRDQPKQIHTFRVPIIEEEDHKELYHLLFRFVGARVRLPAFQYATQVAAGATSSANDLLFDTVAANVRGGSWAAIFDGDWEFLGYVKVASVSVTGAHLTEGLPFDVPEDAWVMWAPQYRIPSDRGLLFGYPHGSATFQLEVVEDTDLLHPLQQAVTFTTLASYPILPDPYGVTDVAQGFHKRLMTLDNELVPPVDYTIDRNTLTSQTRAYLIETEELPRWKAFAQRIMGSQKAFLLPSFHDDLHLLTKPDLGATELVTADHGFRVFMARTRGAYSYLRLTTARGVIHRQVIDMQESLIDGNPTLVLNQALSSQPGGNEISSISVMTLCRLVGDEINVETNQNYAIVTFAVQAVNE